MTSRLRRFGSALKCPAVTAAGAFRSMEGAPSALAVPGWGRNAGMRVTGESAPDKFDSGPPAAPPVACACRAWLKPAAAQRTYHKDLVNPEMTSPGRIGRTLLCGGTLLLGHVAGTGAGTGANEQEVAGRWHRLKGIDTQTRARANHHVSANLPLDGGWSGHNRDTQDRVASGERR
jgi:hypothetical protein